MAKTYWITPGDSSLAPPSFSGLAPVFTQFLDGAGGTAIPPGITEAIAGTGVYSFVYGPTIGMFFTVDWGLSVSSSFRYTKGNLDPIQAVDEHVGGILNNTDSYGDAVTDPTTLIGFAKRLMQFNEGNSYFDKATGVWSIFSQGSSTLLRIKDLTNTVTAATKT